jgi:hypothetical protein
MTGMSVTYEIRVKGHLSPDWSEWLQGMGITHTPDGDTVIVGAVRDQASLFGVLLKLRDLGLVLIAVNQVSPEPK